MAAYFLFSGLGHHSDVSFVYTLPLSISEFFFFSALVTPLYTLHASFRYINRYFEEISSSQFIDFPCVIRFISLFATAICPYIESEADAGGKETSVCNPIRYLQKSSNQTCYFELFKRYIMALYSSMSTFTRLLLPCSFSGTKERERVCVWCAAKYFLCHLSLNKCIYGTHPTFYRLLYRCYELIITNIKRNGEWIWWHIPNLCGTDIEWQKRDICVHETYGWTEKKSSLMTYAPPVPMIRSLSSLFFGLPVRLHDNQKFRFLPADKRFLFFLLCEWENVRVLLPASWASSSKWTRDMIWTVDSAAVIEISVPMVKCL